MPLRAPAGLLARPPLLVLLGLLARPCLLALPCFLALAACPSIDPDPDPDPAPSRAEVEALVREAIELGCDAASLDALADAEPASVREAVRQVDAERSSPPAGVSHNHPVDIPLSVPLLQEFTFEYSVLMPEGSPPGQLPLFVDPGHPVDDLEDPSTRSYRASLAGEPFVWAQLHMFNRLYTELGPDDYAARVLDDPAFDTVDAAMDLALLTEAMVAELIREYPVDPARIYIGGISAEGNAAWLGGILSAENYAGVLPYSAGVSGYDDLLWSNLRNAAIAVVHGDADDVTPVAPVDEITERLQGEGYDLEYWRLPGEGHGGGFFQTFPLAMEWLRQRENLPDPATVHKAIISERDPDAWWLAATEFSEPIPGDARLYPGAPPAQLVATWGDGAVEVEGFGVDAMQLRWLAGAAGPARGEEGQSLQVSWNGEDLGAFPLEEDPVLGLWDYCARGDVRRLWAGAVELSP